jgi:CubicO group peptidase (beta-lactamase class C family)
LPDACVKTGMTRTVSAVSTGLVVLFLATALSAQSSAPDLTGLWAAKKRFGPDIRGPLIILRNGTRWNAEISGVRVAVRSDGAVLSFQLPNGKGQFRGKLTGQEIVGHWFGEKSDFNLTAYATPVTLEAYGANRWRGQVAPLEATSTFYMPVTRRADGTYSTYLRNPERNQGRFIPVSGIRTNGEAVELTGRRGNQADAVIAKGLYDNGLIRVSLNGTSFEFSRVDGHSSSAFYPRGNPPERYAYRAPLKTDDGWPVAGVEDVGISREAIEKFVQMLIDKPMDSITTPQVHSVLISRHGKLVVEEYFHGYDRNTPHDTRSAAKSWVAVLLGAAMQTGVPISTTTPVYKTMLGAVPENLDPRKRAMTLEHLISMTAGYDCSGETAPGDEDVMQQQTKERDWYRYTLDVPMITAPGDTIVYCSIEPNLAGGMLEKIAREPMPEMFHRLVAKPLRMKGYHLFMAPTGHAYGGGGHHFPPREFMKLAQLMLNDGKWEGKQIISREWARKSGSALRNLTRSQQYGWLWNSLEYAHKGRTVRGFFAGGNGGQIFMGIPELDLVIAFTGGNYSQATTFVAQREYIPRFILPAID